jgi:hypothetical protein
MEIVSNTDAGVKPAPYHSVNGQWPAPASQLPKLTGPEALAAAKRLYRIGMGRAFTGKWKLTSGNRYTWPRRGVFYVNAEAGWWRLVHDLSHHIHHRKHPGKKPHDFRHAFVERELIKEVVSRGWLDGKLRRPERPEPDVTAIRHQRVLEAIARWERKAKRAETALRKLRRQRAYYERKAA